MSTKRCERRCARVIAIVVALGAVAAAAISAAQVVTAPSWLRGFLWPLDVAVAAELLAFALLAAAGAAFHPAVLVVAALPALAQVLGDYESESVYLPILALGVIALLFAYRRSRLGVRSLGRARSALLMLAIAGALGGVIAMQAPMKVVFWERLRHETGTVESRTFVTDGDCRVLPARDVDLIEQGCDIVIPARRARFVIGYSAAAVVLGLAAVAGAATPDKNTVDAAVSSAG